MNERGGFMTTSVRTVRREARLRSSHGMQCTRQGGASSEGGECYVRCSYKVHREDTVHGACYPGVHAPGRMARKRQPNTNAQASPAAGCRRSPRRRLRVNSSSIRSQDKYNRKNNSHPPKVMPAMPFARTILMPMAMCSQVPRLSPVHIAP